MQLSRYRYKKQKEKHFCNTCKKEFLLFELWKKDTRILCKTCYLNDDLYIAYQGWKDIYNEE